MATWWVSMGLFWRMPIELVLSRYWAMEWRVKCWGTFLNFRWDLWRKSKAANSTGPTLTSRNSTCWRLMILWLGLFFDFLPCLNYLWPILSHFQFCWTYNLHLLLPPLIRVALYITGQAHRLSVNSKSHDYLLNPKFLPEEQPGHDPIKNSRFFIGQKQSRDFFWQFYCSNPAKRSYAEMFLQDRVQVDAKNDLILVEKERKTNW